jgi:hypothetical protein
MALSQLHLLSLVLMLTLALSAAWAQDDSAQQPSGATQQPSDTTQQPSTTPVPAYGQSTATPQVSPFPPLSGLDEPALEPNIAPRSFLQPDFRITQVIDTNSTNQLGHTPVFSATHLQGSMDLLRLWSRYAAQIAYVGNGTLYLNRNVADSQAHQLYLAQRVLWRTGSLQVRDVFSYLPEGSFGSGAFGGSGAVGGMGGLGGGGIGGFGGGGGGINLFGGSTLGAVGQIPRIGNVATLDVQQSLSPRSTVTAAGAFGLTHFTQSGAPGTKNGNLIDARQATGTFGYNYSINRRNTVAVSYLHGEFTFPRAGTGSFSTDVIHLLYGYQISGRMSLTLGGGPQYIRFSNQVLAPSNRLTFSARAGLRYQFPRTGLAFNYNRFVSGGSGLFAGAQTDLAQLTVTHPISRQYTFFADFGYSHNKRLQTSGSGVPGNTFNSGFAGARLSRIFSRTLTGYALYQFHTVWFDSSFCTTGTSCSRTLDRNLFGVGLDWHPHAIRLD